MRFNFRFVFLALFSFFFVVALTGGLLWGNLNYTNRVPGGVDFFPIWQGARNFSMQADQPYQDWTAQVQPLISGESAKPGESLPRVSLPFYILQLFFPLGLISNPALARAAWMVLLEISLVGLTLLAVRLSGWQPPRLYLLVLLFFGLFFDPALAALFSGNAVIVQAVLLFGALRALEFGSDELAGALIALAFFNLEAVGPVIILLLMWAWTAKRLRILGGFLMATIILVGVSILFMSSWPWPFLLAIVSNWLTNTNSSTFSVFESWFPAIGIHLGQILSVATALMLMIEWRAVRGKDARWLLWTASLTAAATPLLGMPSVPAGLVLSVPALFLALSVMEQRWGRFGRSSAVLILAGVFLGLWTAGQAGFGSIFILLFPLFLIFLLYWIRLWFVRPPRLWADMIAEKE